MASQPFTLASYNLADSSLASSSSCLNQSHRLIYFQAPAILCLYKEPKAAATKSLQPLPTAIKPKHSSACAQAPNQILASSPSPISANSIITNCPQREERNQIEKRKKPAAAQSIRRARAPP
ncbi:hypothetical protein M0R45_007053 [Rubus argutus]|uniref:Uncharacterized protein n=1 Tax=Rubus argutus TaxID=59490 RepID=A0AAW1YSC7_RUBAR